MNFGRKYADFWRGVAQGWGFRSRQRSDEDFGAWLSRETERWIKDGNRG